jgi:beta-lactamase regulating signal transducer with metallopeptidase domain
VWMIASMKFLIPFSILINAGEILRTSFAASIRSSAVTAAMEQIARPFPQTSSISITDYYDKASTVAAYHANPLLVILHIVWLCGFLAVVISWALAWNRIRSAVHTSSQVTSIGKVPVLTSKQLIEPAVFGIFRPVLLLPEILNSRLSESQLNTIVAHEMCHIRRRDNLSAAIQMTVQAVFWFHPVVWWIKARLMEERERACDEAVLQSGAEAQLYAESILNVCKFCIESPLACTSGVSGSNLKQRIVRIMTKQIASKLDFSRKLLLSMAGIAVLAMPVILGLAHTAQVRAQSTAGSPGKDIADTWQGTLSAGKDLRVVFKISLP